METKITKKQNEVLSYIKKFTVEHGYPPAIREIGAALGLSSPATVHTHLKKLEASGCIRKATSKFRTIEILVENEFDKRNENVVKVPLLGTITAGSPIEAIENPTDFFELPVSLVPSKENVFTLKVSGASMVNKGIYDGDVVVVAKQKVARDGEIVVAMTAENEVTLKTFYKEKDHIRLQPENDEMEPIILDNVSILGKAIGLYRSL